MGCTCFSDVFVLARGTLILLIESRVHGTNLFPLQRPYSTVLGDGLSRTIKLWRKYFITCHYFQGTWVWVCVCVCFFFNVVVTREKLENDNGLSH